jgi:hypothetical protein
MTNSQNQCFSTRKKYDNISPMIRGQLGLNTSHLLLFLKGQLNLPIISQKFCNLVFMSKLIIFIVSGFDILLKIALFATSLHQAFWTFQNIVTFFLHDRRISVALIQLRVFGKR